VYPKGNVKLSKLMVVIYEFDIKCTQFYNYLDMQKQYIIFEFQMRIMYVPLYTIFKRLQLLFIFRDPLT